VTELSYMGNQGNNYAYNSVTFAENEERSPWEPFHVQHGLAPSESAVSVFSSVRSTAFTLGLREKHWREHVRHLLRGMDPHGPPTLLARSDRRPPVRRARRLRQERRADRLAARYRADAGRRVLGLPADPELHLSTRDLRRRAVGDEAQGGAGRAHSNVPPRGHSCHRGGWGDQRVLANHGLQLSEDGAGRSVALRLAA